MSTWNTAKQHAHDASGIKNPEDHEWESKIGVYYPIEALLKDLTQTPADIKKIETHCFDLSIELLRDSEHFKKIDSHFEADGLLCTYLCNLDNRKYTVKVTPI